MVVWDYAQTCESIELKQKENLKTTQAIDKHYHTSLLTNENFVMQDRLFATSERDVETSMTSVYFSWSQATLVMSSADIKWFASLLISGQNSSCWYVTVARCNPSKSGTWKKLEVWLEDLETVVRDVASLFWWNYFRWDLIAFVESAGNIFWDLFLKGVLFSLPSNVDWSSINIISGIDSRASCQALMNWRWNPVMT